MPSKSTAKKKSTKKTTTKKSGASRKKATKKVTKKTSRVRRRLRGQSAITDKPKKGSKLPTFLVESPTAAQQKKGAVDVAAALANFTAGDVAKKAIESAYADDKATVMKAAFQHWADEYANTGVLPSNFYVQDEAGNKVTYSFTSAVTLDQGKIEALADIGFDAKEPEDPEDEDSKAKWVHVAAVHVDMTTVSGNERAFEALENFLDVLAEEFGEDESEKIAVIEEKLNGLFFSRLPEVIKSVKLDDKKATDADKIKAVIDILKPRQSPRSAKSVKSQDDCIRQFAPKSGE